VKVHWKDTFYIKLLCVRSNVASYLQLAGKGLVV